MCTIAKHNKVSKGYVKAYGLRLFKNDRIVSAASEYIWSCVEGETIEDKAEEHTKFDDDHNLIIGRGYFHLSKNKNKLIEDSISWIMAHRHVWRSSDYAALICQYTIPKGEEYIVGVCYQCSDVMDGMSAILAKKIRFDKIVDSIYVDSISLQYYIDKFA